MAVDIREFINPTETAIIITECQEAVIGENSPLKGLLQVVQESRMLEHLAALLEVARRVKVKIFHATVERRDDGFGDPLNTPLTRMMAKHGGASSGLAPGSAGAQIVKILGPAPEDIVLPRLHGMTSFHETGLDHFLRNTGVKNVIVTGVSLNIAVTSAVIEAVNRGYNVVVAKDCVAADPPEYGEAVFKYTLRNLCYLTDSATIQTIWKESF